MLEVVYKKFPYFIMLAEILAAQQIDAKPIMNKREIEEVALQQHQSVQSCPTHQYFSYELKTCRDCETFCVKNLEEPTCERQCAAYFLKNELKKIFDEKDDEIARLNKTIQEIGAKEISYSWPTAVQLLQVLAIILVVLFIIWKFLKKLTRHWHRIPHQDPLNEKEAKSQPQNKERGNRDDDITVPPKDARQEEFGTVGALPFEQDKTFNISQDDDTSSSDDSTSVPPDSDVHEEIGLAGGPPAEKA